uniref:Uncharacterized protein n=1 Tax=Acetithermum autotrophicum TaxID=1446466 RepID=H5SSP3_ACEAU|nr:hypothetical protein HGMM_OP3C340 [Candidatus Acetothermum autotrophicum]
MTRTQHSCKRIGQALGLFALGLALLIAAYSVTATNGEHRESEIPGSGFLVIFSPLVYGVYLDKEVEFVHKEIKIVVERAVDHDYRPLYYLAGKPGEQQKQQLPKFTGYVKATAKNFKDILADTARGILFVSTHGGKGELLVEYVGNMFECEEKVKELEKGIFNKGEIKCVEFAFGRASSVGIAITGQAINKYFNDTETIVYISACNSWSLQNAFSKARDFFGYDGTCPSEGAAESARVLWGRLHGVVDGGTKRPATVAGQGLPNKLQHRHRSGALDTVLSPAVWEHYPANNQTFDVPTEVQGRVRFDARMARIDTTFTAGAVISVDRDGNSCSAEILNARWASDFELQFTLRLNTPGEARLRVSSSITQAVGKFWANPLDGNTRWRGGEGTDAALGEIQESDEDGQDHIGPNRDDFVWKVKCGKGTSFSFTAPVGIGGSCKAKTPALGSIQISEIWATVLNCNTGQPLPQGTPVTFTVNLKPGKEKPEHISDIESITVSAPGFEATTVQGPFTAFRVSGPGFSFQVINLGTVCLKPK